MRQHLDLMQDILDHGHTHEDRTGIGRRSIFGTQIRFRMSDGFPLTTTRQMYPSTMIRELLWFLTGSSDASDVKIWRHWAVRPSDIDDFMDQHANMIGADTDAVRVHMDGYLNSVGHMYGAAWRNAPRSVNHVLLPQIPIEDMPSDRLAGYEETYTSIIKGLQNQGDPEAYVPTRAETYNFQYRQTCDQINELILGLRQRPWSSRHVVSAWIPEWIPSETLSPQANVLLDLGALAPCHFAFQCFVSPPAEGSDRLRLSLMLNMRSSDVAVGWSYNIAQYALLLHLIASVTNMEPYELIYVGGDVHLYTNQLDTVREQLSRDPLPMPQIWVNPAIKDIFAFTEQDIKISDYQYHDAIIHQVAV